MQNPSVVLHRQRDATLRPIANLNAVCGMLFLLPGDPQETLSERMQSLLLDLCVSSCYPAFPARAAHDFGNLRAIGGDRYSIDCPISNESHPGYALAPSNSFVNPVVRVNRFWCWDHGNRYADF